MDDYNDDYEFQDERIAYQRAGRAIGLGNVMVGEQFARLQRYIHRADLDVVGRFLEDVQRFCVDNRKRFDRDTYERIARAFGRANYLNPAACVLAVTRALNVDLKVIRSAFRSQVLLDECTEHDVTVLDVFRYAALIESLQ